MIRKLEDGNWFLNITLGGRGGKQIKRIFTTKGEAERFKLWAQAEYLKDPAWSPRQQRDNRRLLDLANSWFAHHGSVLRAAEHTQKRLLRTIQELGNPRACEFRAENFSDYRERRLAEGIAPATLNREHAHLRALFTELARLGDWEGPNPLSRIRQFRVAERELSFLDDAQIDRLLEECTRSRNPHLLLITKVCLAIGARWSEVEGLRIGQVRNATISLRGKSGKVRSIPIARKLEQALVKHFQANGMEDRLFTSASSAFREAVQRAGIKLPRGQNNHVLRHSFASHFMIKGGNIIALQRILGHESLAMTMRYAHLAPEHLEEARRLNPLADQLLE